MGKGSKEGNYLRVLSIIYDMFESLHGQVLKRVGFLFFVAMSKVPNDSYCMAWVQ